MSEFGAFLRKITLMPRPHKTPNLAPPPPGSGLLHVWWGEADLRGNTVYQDVAVASNGKEQSTGSQLRLVLLGFSPSWR